MTNWNDLSLVGDNLVSYFTGSYAVLATFIIVLFLLLLLARGLEFRYATLFVLPLLGGFSIIGWLGSSWPVQVALLLVGLVYGFAVVRLTT